jgi:hypothetical protein
VVKVGLTARHAPGLEALLSNAQAVRRYSLGANVAWVAWPDDHPLDELDAGLRELEIAGMVLAGPPERLLLGRATGGAFAKRVRSAIDPHARFEEI